MDLCVCFRFEKCHKNGKSKALSKEIPISEKTNTGGNQGTFPPLPSNNNKAENSRAKIKDVLIFFPNEFEISKIDCSDIVFLFKLIWSKFEY